MKLYEMSYAIERLWLELDEIINSDIPTDEALQAFDERLGEIEQAKEIKCLNLACLIKQLEAESAAYKCEKLRIQHRQSVTDNAIERLKTYLTANLNGEKLKDERVSISWRKSEKVELSCEVDSLPRDLCRIKVEANMTAIKDRLKAGEIVEGASLVEKNNVQIK